MPKRNLQRFLTLAIVLSLMNISTTGCNRTYHINLTTPKQNKCHILQSQFVQPDLWLRNTILHTFLQVLLQQKRVSRKKIKRSTVCVCFFLESTRGIFLAWRIPSNQNCQKIGGTNMNKEDEANISCTQFNRNTIFGDPVDPR